MMQKRQRKKIVLSLLIIATLIMPTLSASAKIYKKNDSIEEYEVSNGVIRFEEIIPINIPPEYGSMPEGAYYRVNVYGVDIGEGVVLIDCGDDLLAKELYKSVHKAFKKPVVAVYLTHYHADHAGGGSYFQSKGVPVYSPMAETYFIMAGANVGGNPIPDQFTYTGYMPDYSYEYGSLEDGFSVAPEPGHTMGEVSITYSSSDATYLFTSDTILPMMSDDVNDLDMTYELTIGTAYQNYLNSVPEYDLYSTQLATLNAMQYAVFGYDYVLTGHINLMDAYTAAYYIGYTIGTLQYFPYL